MISVFLPPSASTEVNLSLIAVVVQDDQLLELALSEAKELLKGHWQLIVPVEAVTCCAVLLPTTRKRWLQQTLPFAVEDLLAEDVEQMHLAIGAPMDDGKHRVMAVNRNWLSAWLEAIGSKPQAIWVDADLLPQEGTQLCWRQGRWLLGGAGAARVALSAEDWPIIQDLCPEPVTAYGPDIQHLGVAQYSVMHEPERFLISHLASTDLAQGEFASQGQSSWWVRGKPVGIAVAVCLALQVSFNLAQGWYFNNAADGYATASTALYQQLFPEDRRIVNLRAQFDQHLAQGSLARQSLLGLLSQVAGQEPDGLRIEQLNYRQEQADLDVLVRAASFEILELAQGRWQAAGLNVSMGTSTRDLSGVSVRIVIGG